MNPGWKMAGISFINQRINVLFYFPEIRTEYLLLFHLLGLFVVLFCYCCFYLFILPSEIPFYLEHMFLQLAARHTLSDQEVEPFYSLKLKCFSNLLIFLTAVAQRVARTSGVN